MTKQSHKKAIRNYQKAGGNFRTKSLISIRKESDLAAFYYPGIEGVLERIENKGDAQKKLCRYHKTIGLISTRSAKYYPVLTARAAIMSEIADINVIPLMIKYDNVKNLPYILEKIAINFQAIYLSDLNHVEKAVMENAKKLNLPLISQDESLAAAVLAGVMNAAKMHKKTLKKARITIEGIDPVIIELVNLLIQENASNVRIIDDRGPIYSRRPNMNKAKNNLAKLLKLSKDESTYDEVMGETDIYINAQPEDLTEKKTRLLAPKAVIISLKAANVKKMSKQTLVSTLPKLPNHITDLHIASAIAYAVSEGKKYNEKMISQAIKGLASVYKSPKSIKLIPGLLEKNLVKKVAKSIK